MVKKTAKSKSKIKNIFEINNMDDLVRDCNQKDENNQIHELLPKHPCRILMVGGSGQGKSNLAIQMLYKPMLIYEKLWA